MRITVKNLKIVKMKLFKSNITALQKVRNYLTYSNKMNATLVILSEPNNEKRLKAVELINEAINILNEIE